MSTEVDKTVLPDESKPKTTHTIRQIEVKKGIAYDTNNLHHTLSVGLIAELEENASLPFVTTCLERFIDERLERELKERQPRQTSPQHSNEPLSFDPETLQWRTSEGKHGKLELIGIEDNHTKELAERITNGMRDYMEFTYWIFKDKVTIGRRKVR